jgi:hypothetical protein
VRQTFAVSEFFSPSGHMGDGAQPGHVTVDVSNGACKPRPLGAQGDCYRFVYRPGELLWAGVYWQHPANNWGSRPGRNLAAPFTRIRFVAASDADELPVQFIGGGIRDRQKPFADSFRVAQLETVTREWQAFSLDISGQTIDSVIGAFAWVTAYPADTDPRTASPIVLYVDDVVWE